MRIIVAALACCIAYPAHAADPSPIPAAPIASSLNLVCLGAGSANRASSMYGFGNNGWGQIIGQKEVPFDDQVTLEIQGDSGRIRMPRSMLPKIRGGKEGWFEVKDVRWSENEIIGTVQVNIVNSPKLRVDRLQGMIAINGKAGDYSGRCEPFDPATVQRKF
ncbi:MAG TPA: hypothetical protein VJM34_06945 [Novosphingobium sp.]|nr:hypothetical protein [Novosphingobium sp.]